MVDIVNDSKPRTLAEALAAKDAILNHTDRVLTREGAIRIGQNRILSLRNN
jgi:hypothetical protein